MQISYNALNHAQTIARNRIEFLRQQIPDLRVVDIGGAAAG